MTAGPPGGPADLDEAEGTGGRGVPPAGWIEQALREHDEHHEHDTDEPRARPGSRP